ncbi:MAG: helix-hairpin-helix domain-containing protein [Acidobacteria bacterium]|nr:helix-hairpin-helix domain-containing protein [Acidobacteriota bacterium]
MNRFVSALAFSLLACSLLASAAVAQQLPDGPGRAETEKLCKQCHEVARSISPRLDRDGWGQTMTKMTAFGMKSTADEYALVLDYLVKNYPAEDVPRINVNQASAIQLESVLGLRRSQAKDVLAYREKNGDFKTIDDLKKVPGLDAAKLDAKKDRILF